jgi:hypothetical protein
MDEAEAGEEMASEKGGLKSKLRERERCGGSASSGSLTDG